jgi:hypothetical protein
MPNKSRHAIQWRAVETPLRVPLPCLTIDVEYSFFLKALDDDRKPSKRSRAAAKRHQKGVRKGVTLNSEP